VVDLSVVSRVLLDKVVHPQKKLRKARFSSCFRQFFFKSFGFELLLPKLPTQESKRIFEKSQTLENL